MTDAYIFVGPTLPPSERRDSVLDGGQKIVFLPPVSEGDIFALVQKKPSIIGIIDGYFENVPSVWHKEILFAMSEGIHVLGAASMGALRAAELTSFGMEGVGEIYRAFAHGLLEDDDEVTIAHGPEELGFPALSEAMVNIHYTLADAAAKGIVKASDHAALLETAKDLHYKDRNYERIMSLAPRYGVHDAALKDFNDWLVHGRKDQKRVDAEALVREIRKRLENSPVPRKEIAYNFESTVIWERSRRHI